MTEKPRILVIDAEERFRRILSKILESCGYAVTVKTCGVDGLSAYIQTPFPLVITDVEIPDMTGVELLRQIKGMSGNSEIIVMNRQTALKDAISAMRAGAYDCLLKPFRDTAVICNTAHRALEKVRLQKQNKNLIYALKQHNKILKTSNVRLKQLATHDDLTGLYNHRYFQNRMKTELYRAKRYPESFSILFIDLDHFKTYNDTNGHLAGDHLLKTMGAILCKSFRKTDVVARYGGDEFVVILPETSKAQVRLIAAKLHKRVAGYPFGRCDSMPGNRITVSIGHATYPEDGSSADALLGHADQMLYNGKKNRGRFSPYALPKTKEPIAEIQ